MSFLQDFSASILMLVIMAISFRGYGRVLARWLRIPLPPFEKSFLHIWLGFAGILLMVQTIHLFRPIQWLESLCILVPGLVLGIRGIHSPNLLRLQWRRSGTLTIILIVAVVLLAAIRGMREPTHFDAGLYYFTSIRWINEHPLVPGLANLAKHLGFNQTHFQLAALFNFFPHHNHGYNVVTPFFFALGVAQFIWGMSLMRTVRTSRICIARISLGLVMVPILLSMLCLSDLASPRADAISYLLQIVIFQFFVMVVVHAGSSVRWRAYARVVLILSLALLSVKLSNVAFALGCCLVAVGIDVINHPPAVLRRWFPTLIFCLVFFAVFILRGYVQSGFPLYPSHVLPINFDWSKTVLEAKEHSLVIKEWARMPRQPLHSVIGKKDWFGDWLGRTMADKTFVVPFMAGILSWAIFALVKCRIGYFVHESLGSFTAWRFVCLLFPVCFGLGFWFYTVPEPRFAGGLLWMIAFIPVLIFMLADKSMRVIKFLRRNLVLAAFVMLTILCFSSIISAIHVKDGYATFPSPALKQITNPHGVRLYLPVEGVQIWDAPLPAAHHMSPDLQMRGESLQQGFRTNRSS